MENEELIKEAVDLLNATKHNWQKQAELELLRQSLEVGEPAEVEIKCNGKTLHCSGLTDPDDRVRMAYFVGRYGESLKASERELKRKFAGVLEKLKEYKA